MSKQKKEIFPIRIFCAKCEALLYHYRKEGPGGLVKCFVNGITEDKTKGDLKCPRCGQEFARLSQIHGRAIHKIIKGKVFFRGHCKK